MSEAQSAASTAEEPRAHGDWFCNWIRQGAEHVAEILTPPQSAGRHFRQARIEFLRGIREIIDHRIERLSRDTASKGTRVTVE